MIQVTMSISEYLFLIAGLGMLLTSMAQYGRRTRDWVGVATMFYRRISMTAAEYKWYRIGISGIIVGILVKVINLIFWPV